MGYTDDMHTYGGFSPSEEPIESKGPNHTLGSWLKAPVKPILVRGRHHTGLLTHLHQCLRSEDVFDLTGADAKGESSECAMRGSVGVATHNN